MKLHLRSLAATLTAVTLLPASSQAELIILGVTDGDLAGGNPKSVILQATTAVADLTLWGIGSANNGGGSDGEEFTLPAGSADAGDVIVVAANTSSFDFYINNFVQDFTLFLNGAANINGDDAIELFNNGVVFDTYGDIDTLGDGETWDYTDGFTMRIDGDAGPFDQANYVSNVGAFDGLNIEQHIDLFATAGFTPIEAPTELRIISMTSDLESNLFTVEWTSIENRVYRVESSADLTSWEEVDMDPIAGAPGATSVADIKTPDGATEYFYRIVETGIDAG